MPEYLRLEVRHSADGAVLGMRALVDGNFQATRERFDSKRKSGARAMRGVEAGLYTLRDLQVRVVE